MAKSASLPIVNCKKCPSKKETNFWSSDGWDRMSDWVCDAANKTIAKSVEWHNNIAIPDWCPILKKDTEETKRELVFLVTITEPNSIKNKIFSSEALVLEALSLFYLNQFKTWRKTQTEVTDQTLLDEHEKQFLSVVSFEQLNELRSRYYNSFSYFFTQEIYIDEGF